MFARSTRLIISKSHLTSLSIRYASCPLSSSASALFFQLFLFFLPSHFLSFSFSFFSNFYFSLSFSLYISLSLPPSLNPSLFLPFTSTCPLPLPLKLLLPLPLPLPLRLPLSSRQEISPNASCPACNYPVFNQGEQIIC